MYAGVGTITAAPAGQAAVTPTDVVRAPSRSRVTKGQCSEQNQVLPSDGARIEQGERGPSCATYRGHPLALTQLELGLLASLVRAGGRPVAREVLLRECWKTRTISDFARMEAAVCRLRKKLCASTQLSVQMDRGLGYRIMRRALGEPRPRSRRVLVAEPDLRVRQALAKNLREFAVDTATTRARTIRLVRDRSYVAAFIATRLRDGVTFDLLPLSCPTMMLAEDDADAQRSLDRGASACWQKLDDDPSALRAFARHAASASDAYAEVLSAGGPTSET